MSLGYDRGTDWTASAEDLFQDASINVTDPCTVTLPDALEGVKATIKNTGDSTLTINKPDATLLFTLLAGGEVTIRTYIDSSSVPQYETFQTYAITNISADRSYDANATTTDELADALGTLIADLRAKGIVN